MTRPQWRDAHLFPVGAAVVMALLAVGEAGLDPTYRPDFDALTLVAAWIGLAFLASTRFPAAGTALVAAFYPVSVLVDAPGPGGAGLIAVLLASGWAGYAAGARASLVGVTAAVVLFVVTDASLRGVGWDTVFFPAVFYPGRWAGALVRREQARSAQLVELTAVLDAQREATAHAAVVEERTRIAREVHDAVAHSVSVMTLQVGGLRRQLADLLADRPAERDVMLGIERLGRESVEELRSLVGILRETRTADAPATVPSLARLPELAADVRAAGLPVELDADGATVELPRSLDVAAYRIVQEGLTNVLRHAAGARTCVRVRGAEDAVRVTVENQAPPGPPVLARATGAGGAEGHGLVGMRERAQLFGGSLEAGPTAEGGFRVHAVLPLRGRWS